MADVDPDDPAAAAPFPAPDFWSRQKRSPNLNLIEQFFAKANIGSERCTNRRNGPQHRGRIPQSPSYQPTSSPRDITRLTQNASWISN
ncbi:hypothetical protein NKI61_24055 [Mesorhizobium sp. M0514]|uniref:hypothetical protein n=1 Tax=Mesorhizobium sp. M0514 TaxID=2956955 RepID=UPI00333A0C03